MTKEKVINPVKQLDKITQFNCTYKKKHIPNFVPSIWNVEYLVVLEIGQKMWCGHELSKGFATDCKSGGLLTLQRGRV